MKISRILLLSMAASFALAACGDDETTTEPTNDAGTDTGAAVELCDDGIDNDDDGATDCDDSDCAADDACQTAGEICDDGLDNDENGATDCDDDACSIDPACLEQCDDGVDNDDDGMIDCEDSDCANALACIDMGGCDPACADGQECIQGVCADAADCDTYEPAENWSYISNIILPTSADDCCFDLDGDSEIDNGLFGLLGIVGSLAGDPQPLITDAIAEDSISLLAEYYEWPEGDGAAKWHFFLGTNDVDGDGMPDQDYDTERALGDGVFLIEDESFGPYGSFIRLNDLTVAGNVVSQEAGTFMLALPLEGLLPGLGNVNVAIEQAQFEATLDASDVEFTDASTNGAKLGGFVRLSTVFDILDDVLGTCACAGVEPGTSILNYGENAETGKYEVACTQSTFDASACGEEDLVCSNINLVCGTGASLIGSLNLGDIDTDNSGIGDALSVGLYLEMVGADIAEGICETETAETTETTEM